MDYNISDNGHLDWLLYQNIFPLRESNSILFAKSKGFTFKELKSVVGSPFTELAFEFYYKKEFMLKVLIKTHGDGQNWRLRDMIFISS